MIRFEFLKIWRNKKIMLFLLLLIILNAAVFSFHIQSDHLVQGGYKTYYEAAYEQDNPLAWLKEQEDQINFQRSSGFAVSIDDMKAVPNIYYYEKNYGEQWVKQQWLVAAESKGNDADSFQMKQEAIAQIRAEIQAADGYVAWKASIAQDANQRSRISIFRKHSADKSIAQRTFEAYDALEVSITKAEPSAGLQQVLNFTPLDILIIAWMVYLVLHLIMKEKENGYLTYSKSMAYGGIRQYICKLFVMNILVIVGCFLMMAECAVLSILAYGGLDVQAPVQSIAFLSMTPYGMSIGQFLICIFIIRAASFCLLAVILSAAAYACNSLGVLLLLLILVYGGSFLLYTNFSAVSQFAFLHDINLYVLLHPVKLLADYSFFRIGSVALNKVSMVAVLPLVLFAMSLIGCFWYCKPIRQQRRILPQYARALHIKSSCLGWQELRKLLFKDKLLYGMLFAVCIGIFQIAQQQSITTNKDRQYNYYIDTIGDHVSVQANQRIEEQEQVFRLLQEQYQNSVTLAEQSQLARKLEGLEAFQEYKAAYEQRKREAVDRKLLKEDVYRLLFEDGAMKKSSYLLTVTCLILFLVQSYHRELKSGMLTLQNSSPSRCDVHNWKIRHLFCIVTIMTIILYVAQLIRIIQLYPSISFQTPLYEIQDYFNSGIAIPLWQFLTWMLAAQLLLLLTWILLLCEIMKRWNQRTFVMLGAFLLMLFPVMLPDNFQSIGLNILYQLFYPYRWLMHGYAAYTTLLLILLAAVLFYKKHHLKKGFFFGFNRFI